MDITGFTDADLARLALSTRLRDLAEALRVAVATDDPDLAGKLWSLLSTEVPAVQRAIIGHVRATGGTWQQVAALGALTEAEARDRFDTADIEPTTDPAAAAATLDEWYLRHAQVEPLAQLRDPFSRLLAAHNRETHECLICVKYRGGVLPAYGGHPTPPGGSLHDDGTFRVGHGPTTAWPAGTLLIESHRHFLDHAEMNDAEAAAIGPLIRRFTGPIKEATGATRVHTFSCMEAAEHFHVWLVPRPPGAQANRKHIADPGHCTRPEAEAATARIRAALERTR